MTTNETLFFRDRGVFDSVRDKVLPELIESRRTSKKLDIWCAASSSGQEPYSVLMMLDADFPELRSWRIRLLTTDISTTMLDRTREGVYSKLEVGRGLDPAYRTRYMNARGKDWQVKPFLRNQLQLRDLNLNGPWPDLGTFDLIFIRNVLIYFDVPAKQEILTKAHRLLAPDGTLLLGGGETTLGVVKCFQPTKVGSAMIYKPAQRAQKTAS